MKARNRPQCKDSLADAALQTYLMAGTGELLSVSLLLSIDFSCCAAILAGQPCSACLRTNDPCVDKWCHTVEPSWPAEHSDHGLSGAGLLHFEVQSVLGLGMLALLPIGDLGRLACTCTSLRRLVSGAAPSIWRRAAGALIPWHPIWRQQPEADATTVQAILRNHTLCTRCTPCLLCKDARRSSLADFDLHIGHV